MFYVQLPSIFYFDHKIIIHTIKVSIKTSYPRKHSAKMFVGKKNRTTFIYTQ